MKKILTLIAAAAALATPAALAEGLYAEGGYSFISVDAGSDLGAADVDLGAIEGRLGFDFTPNFGVEGEVAIGVSD